MLAPKPLNDAQIGGRFIFCRYWLQGQDINNPTGSIFSHPSDMYDLSLMPGFFITAPLFSVSLQVHVQLYRTKS